MCKLAAAGQYRVQSASVHCRATPPPEKLGQLAHARLQKRMAVGGNMFVHGICGSKFPMLLCSSSRSIKSS
jgi:hypothetical protein